MPRNYKAKPGTRRYKSCDNSKLQKALDRVVAGESQRSVCAELNIPRSTLYNKLKKKDTQKPGRPTVLNEEELSITEHLLATADWGFSFDGMDIMMLVKSYLDKIGRTMAYLRRRPNISPFRVLIRRATCLRATIVFCFATLFRTSLLQ